ncbi:MAG: hypothetical protein ACK5GN_07345, partial [Pseudomonadota bacterium]
IRYLELRAERKRQRQHKRVIGREKLIRQEFDVSYRPDRKGRRMWCLCTQLTCRIKSSHTAQVVNCLWRL